MENKIKSKTHTKQQHMPDSIDEIQFIAAKDCGFFERVKVKTKELLINSTQWLSVLQIDELQVMIHTKYPMICGLFHTN